MRGLSILEKELSVFMQTHMRINSKLASGNTQAAVVFNY